MAQIPPFFSTLKSFIYTSEHKNVSVLCAGGVVIVYGLTSQKCVRYSRYVSVLPFK
jgi:hypothetical protein